MAGISVVENKEEPKIKPDTLENRLFSPLTDQIICGITIKDVIISVMQASYITDLGEYKGSADSWNLERLPKLEYLLKEANFNEEELAYTELQITNICKILEMRMGIYPNIEGPNKIIPYPKPSTYLDKVKDTTDTLPPEELHARVHTTFTYGIGRVGIAMIRQYLGGGCSLEYNGCIIRRGTFEQCEKELFDDLDGVNVGTKLVENVETPSNTTNENLNTECGQ